MEFHWSLSDSKSPQVFRTLLSILADLNNGVVWMVSTRPLISKSSSPNTNTLMTILNARITFGIIVTFRFHSVFSSQTSTRYLSIFSLSFIFTLLSTRTAQLTILQALFLLLTITRSGRLAEIRWSICISKSQIILCLIFKDGLWVVYISFVHMVKFKVFEQFPVGHFFHLIVSSFILFLC